MRKRLLPIVLILILFVSNIHSQTIPPKREFRGAWIATVTNIDWPSGTNPDSQKQQLINLLNGLKAININAVMFQIRPECDALYQSSIEPWSYWLTGRQGTPPNPFYDPLQFAIDEAHKRGMELHAWFNPYRAERSVGNYTLSPDHVINKHSDWILQVGTVKFLNPGLQQVRDYVTSVFMDVARRYDVDGIHIDDYFYVEGITNQDAATFASYPRGFTNIADWRRDNVNLLIKEISDSLKSVKPYIKWGVSPRGIWRPGYPPGITGNDNYNSIYCDAMAWLHSKSIDYINPQLYWAFGGEQDYSKLMPWWADSAGANGRHLYVGHADYRISSSFTASELPNQIRLNRTNKFCQGSVHYNTSSTLANPKGLIDTLKNDLYKYPALVPIMNWKDTLPPNPPQNLRYDRIASTETAGLMWDVPQTASDGDTAARYVVYRFNKGTLNISDLNDPRNIIDMEGQRQSIPSTPATTNDGYYFVVTSLDRNNNESGMSTIINVKAPQVPTLALPLNAAINQRDTITLNWQYPNYASSYEFQLSMDSTFASNIIIDNPAVTDTFMVLTGLLGQQKYYWKLNASNAGGTSLYSQVYNFTTGFPSLAQLVNPTDKTTNIQLRPDFSWNRVSSASTYRFQFAVSLDFNPGSIVVDSSGITDTVYAYSKLNKDLDLNRIYFWRVSGTNQYGTSNWSNISRFKTITATEIAEQDQLPKEFELSQNYPNPFNPTTVINYQISKSDLVTLKVYDILGREAATLVNKEQEAGSYSIQLSADKYNLNSGIYFYQLRAGSFIQTKKMIILK